MKNGNTAQVSRKSKGGMKTGRDVQGPERIRIDREDKSVNEYYLKISNGYKAAKFTTLAVFLVYLIVMMCMYRSSITYDNLMYLIRDFETEVDVSAKGFEGISYAENTRMSFGIYKDRLAVATGSDFTLYNTTGAVELEYDHSMENPKVEAGEKYVLVYDIGGTSYSVYNTIARVSTKKTDFVIQNAAISDSGAFSLITRSKGNRYLVTFYDSSFRELIKIHKDKYVTDVDIDAEGKRYALVSFEAVNSDLVTEVVSGSVRSDENATFTIEGLLPFSVDYFDDGSFVVVCDSAAVFVNSAGEIISQYDYTGMNPVSAYVKGNRLFIIGSENTVGSMSKGIILDSAGNVTDSFSHPAKITHGVLSENYAFFMSEEQLVRRDFAGNMQATACPAYAAALVPCFDNVAICGATEITMGFKEEDKNNSTESTDDTVQVEMEDVGA